MGIIIFIIFLKSLKKKSQDNIEIFKYHVFVCVRCCIVTCTSQLTTIFKSYNIVTHNWGHTSQLSGRLRILNRSTGIWICSKILWVIYWSGHFQIVGAVWLIRPRKTKADLKPRHRTWLRMYTKTRSQEGTAVHFRQTVKSKRARDTKWSAKTGQSRASTREPKITQKSGVSLRNEDA